MAFSGDKVVEFLKPGTVLRNRYRIISVVQKGAYGIVYKAEDLKTSSIYAVKEMISNFTESSDREKTRLFFEREARLLSQITHESIPHLYNYFADNGIYYLVMDYVEGINLSQVVSRHKGKHLSEREVLEWGALISDILSYLHSLPEPIIFRDLKPANVMLTPDKRIVLVDFGLAGMIKQSKKGAPRGGTPGYAAPEQYMGYAEARSDVYSLGATLYYMLSKKKPDRRGKAVQVEPVRKLNSSISSMTNALVMKAIEYDISHRFQSAEEMGDKIRAILDLGTVICPDCKSINLKGASACFECETSLTQVEQNNVFNGQAFVFRSGQQAGNPDELLAIAENNPEDGIYHLKQGHFESWFEYIGEEQLARIARRMRVQGGNMEESLKKFLKYARL
jgi:serine/threonine protein kinase